MGPAGGFPTGGHQAVALGSSARIEDTAAERRHDMVDGDQPECAEAPKNEGMGETWKRTLLNDLALRHHFPKKLPDAGAGRRQLKIGGGPGALDNLQHFAESPPEQRQ